MDLSNLSTHLPLSAPPTDDSINLINKNLSDEFKIGARSIAALYRLSNTKNSLLIAKGYLNALKDINNIIDSNNVNSLNDLKTFITDKIIELSPNDSPTSNNSPDVSNNDLTEANTNDCNQPFKKIDETYKFQLNYPTNHKFPLSRIPLSIERNDKSVTNLADSSDEEVELVDKRKRDENSANNNSKSQFSKNNIKSLSSDETDDYSDNDISFEDFNNSTNNKSLKRKIKDNSHISKKLKFDS